MVLGDSSGTGIAGWVTSLQMAFNTGLSTGAHMPGAGPRPFQAASCSLRLPCGAFSVLNPRTPAGTNPGESGLGLCHVQVTVH